MVREGKMSWDNGIVVVVKLGSCANDGRKSVLRMGDPVCQVSDL